VSVWCRVRFSESVTSALATAVSGVACVVLTVFLAGDADREAEELQTRAVTGGNTSEEDVFLL